MSGFCVNVAWCVVYRSGLVYPPLFPEGPEIYGRREVKMSNETQVKWEYLFVYCTSHVVEGVRRGVEEVGIHEEWVGRSYVEFAGWLGEQGWELVSLDWAGYRLYGPFLAFKRPKV